MISKCLLCFVFTSFSYSVWANNIIEKEEIINGNVAKILAQNTFQQEPLCNLKVVYGGKTFEKYMFDYCATLKTSLIKPNLLKISILNNQGNVELINFFNIDDKINYLTTIEKNYADNIYGMYSYSIKEINDSAIHLMDNSSQDDFIYTNILAKDNSIFSKETDVQKLFFNRDFLTIDYHANKLGMNICNNDSNVVFYCSTGEKILNICLEKYTHGLSYAYGKKDNVELRLTNSLLNDKNKFEFVSGNYQYVLDIQDEILNIYKDDESIYSTSCSYTTEKNT